MCPVAWLSTSIALFLLWSWKTIACCCCRHRWRLYVSKILPKRFCDPPGQYSDARYWHGVFLEVFFWCFISVISYFYSTWICCPEDDRRDTNYHQQGGPNYYSWYGGSKPSQLQHPYPPTWQRVRSVWNCLTTRSRWHVSMHSASDVFKSPGDKASCPMCRKEFRIPPDGIGGLQHHFIVQQLIDQMNVRPDSCDKHRDKQVELYCHDCNENFCHTCLTVVHRNHNMVKYLKLPTVQTKNQWRWWTYSICPGTDKTEWNRISQ